MPKPNKTMLDKLVEVFRGGSKRKPEIIQATTIRDPLSYSMVQRRFGTMAGKMPSMTPERQMYQEGIDARLFPRIRKADELVSERYDDMDLIKDEWNDAIDKAKESMREDWESGLDYQAFEDVDPNYLKVDKPATDLREYWPSSSRSPEEIGGDYAAAQGAYYVARDERHSLRSPQARMLEQTMTPRYRRYQEAMQRRDIDRRVGRVNAAIMNLARQGYSLPEIREILEDERARQAYNRKAMAWKDYQDQWAHVRRFYPNVMKIREDMSLRYPDMSREEIMKATRNPETLDKWYNGQKYKEDRIQGAFGGYNYDYSPYPEVKSFEEFPDELVSMPWRERWERRGY